MRIRRKGDCAVVAGRMVLDNKYLMLCHALVMGQGELEGKRIFHAWVEMQDVVFDYSNDKKVIMRKEQYYDIAKINEEDIVRYTQQEAQKLMLKTGHWGAWDRRLELAWARERMK